MLSGSFAQPCSSARLTVHALLVAFRLLMSDLENLWHAPSVPQIFRVRGAASDAREHSVYRKTVLTRIEEKRQHLATYGWIRPAISPDLIGFSMKPTSRLWDRRQRKAPLRARRGVQPLFLISVRTARGCRRGVRRGHYNENLILLATATPQHH